MCDCVMRACMPVAHANARTRTLGSPIARTRPCIVQHLFAALCILQEPEMMPHEPVPADISASIRYCEPVLPLTSVSPVSPAIRAPPHGIVMPPFASWICAGAPFVLIEEPIMEPLIIDLLQPSSLGYAASGRAASAVTAASSHRTPSRHPFQGFEGGRMCGMRDKETWCMCGTNQIRLGLLATYIYHHVYCSNAKKNFELTCHCHQ
jgi:hypothetical protein